MNETRSSLTIPDQGLTVISGGQSGVDRAALDVAMQLAIPTAGWCPRGRRAEDGVIPGEYSLTETDSWNYAVRTERNVEDSDGTLVIVLNSVRGGTGLTVKLARQHNKPVHIVKLLDGCASACAEKKPTRHVQTVVDWMATHKIRVLNVAGPRGSSDDRIYSLTSQFCREILTAAVSATAETHR